MAALNRLLREPVSPRRRRIKVLAGPDLKTVEQSVKDFLVQGAHVTHLQIDHLPTQPPCQRWQAILTYYTNPEGRRLPRGQCRRCPEQVDCQRFNK